MKENDLYISEEFIDRHTSFDRQKIKNKNESRSNETKIFKTVEVQSNQGSLFLQQLANKNSKIKEVYSMLDKSLLTASPIAKPKKHESERQRPKSNKHLIEKGKIYDKNSISTNIKPTSFDMFKIKLKENLVTSECPQSPFFRNYKTNQGNNSIKNKFTRIYKEIGNMKYFRVDDISRNKNKSKLKDSPIKLSKSLSHLIKKEPLKYESVFTNKNKNKINNHTNNFYQTYKDFNPLNLKNSKKRSATTTNSISRNSYNKNNFGSDYSPNENQKIHKWIVKEKLGQNNDFFSKKSNEIINLLSLADNGEEKNINNNSNNNNNNNIHNGKTSNNGLNEKQMNELDNFVQGFKKKSVLNNNRGSCRKKISSTFSFEKELKNFSNKLLNTQNITPISTKNNKRTLSLLLGVKTQ